MVCQRCAQINNELADLIEEMDQKELETVSDRLYMHEIKRRLINIRLGKDLWENTLLAKHAST